MSPALWIAVAAIVFSAAALAFGWSRIRQAGEKRLAEAEREGARMREEARRDSEAKLKEGELAAKEKLREEARAYLAALGNGATAASQPCERLAIIRQSNGLGQSAEAVTLVAELDEGLKRCP